MSDKYLKRYLAPLAIREMHIMIPKRYHYTTIRMAKMKNSDNKYWQECRETRSFIHCWLEYKMI